MFSLYTATHCHSGSVAQMILTANSISYRLDAFLCIMQENVDGQGSKRCLSMWLMNSLVRNTRLKSYYILLSYHSLRTRHTSWMWGLEVTELPNVKTVPIVAESIQQTFSVHKSNIIRQHSICIPS